MFIVNTSSDADHTGGDPRFARPGGRCPTPAARAWIPPCPRRLSPRSAWDKGRRSSGTRTRRIETATPGLVSASVTYGSEGFQLFNGEPVLFYHMPAAHTDGDTVVFFRGSEVVSVGDLFSTTGYPVIESEKGGGIDGFVDSLNQIITLLVPRENEEGGTYVVPGHGHLSRPQRRGELSRHGHHHSRTHSGHDQEGHDARAGEGREAHLGLRPYLRREDGATDMFVETVYRDLARKSSAQERNRQVSRQAS